jgi:guanine deaminase
MTTGDVFGVHGTAIDAPVLGELRIAPQTLIVVDQTGSIDEVLTPGDPDYDGRRQTLAAAGALVDLGDGEYLLPGLVDLHNHAPQWPQLGKALDVTLAEWLDGYTFPLEARYEDIDFATSVYESLVDAMLANGTTTAVYFATLHLPATQRLVDICLERGQRALVGRVAMDAPDACPDYYRDISARVAIEETVALIDYIKEHPGNSAGLLSPVVTPRFIPSCSDELLQGLGRVVAESGCHVQTHCSESDWAHGYGLDRYGHSDTTTYRDFGLLTRRTVLAHSNFVSPADMEIIATAGAAVAHCPLSNVYFANAVFPTREALDAGVHVGLGTDISGGPSPSLFNAAYNAVVASRVREDGVNASLAAGDRGNPGTRITFAEAFWMATTGGGIALDLPIGVFARGYSFDALIVNTAAPDTDLIVWPELDSPEDIFQKIIHNASRHNVAKVWVQGREVPQVAAGSSIRQAAVISPPPGGESTAAAAAGVGGNSPGEFLGSSQSRTPGAPRVSESANHMAHPLGTAYV